MDDRSIIELYNTRSENAIAETQQKYGSLVKSIANNILGNSSDAEECTQDAYMALWNSIPPSQPRELLPYLARTARNIAINRLNSKNTAKRKGGEYFSALDELEGAIPSGFSIENELEGKRITALLENFLRKLDSDKRRAFVMRYWFSDPISDISETLGMTKGQTKMMLFRTRKELKAYLEKEDVNL